MNKDWLSICEVSDPNFRMALALLDLKSSFGRYVMEAMPDYFTDQESLGPVPLSVLRRVAHDNALKNEGGVWDPLDVSHDRTGEYWNGLVVDGACAHFNIPVRTLCGPDAPEGNSWETMPKEFEYLHYVAKGIGYIMMFEGTSHIMVENALPDYFCLAPAEYIAIDK